MTTQDTVVSDGLVVTPKGVAKLDIGIRDGRIFALETPGKLSGYERINASDFLVLMATGGGILALLFFASSIMTATRKVMAPPLHQFLFR